MTGDADLPDAPGEGVRPEPASDSSADSRAEFERPATTRTTAWISPGR